MPVGVWTRLDSFRRTRLSPAKWRSVLRRAGACGAGARGQQRRCGVSRVEKQRSQCGRERMGGDGGVTLMALCGVKLMGLFTKKCGDSSMINY